jgi:hypothetical protein
MKENLYANVLLRNILRTIQIIESTKIIVETVTFRKFLIFLHFLELVFTNQTKKLWSR